MSRKPSKREMQLERFVIDAAGYIRWALEHNERMGAIGATLGHDIGGLVTHDKVMLPRVTGYARFLIDKDAAVPLPCIKVEVRGGIAYCDDPRVEIIDHDNR